MRILSISGQNIASLADRFEIDFTSEPLRSAGLFAITGETGADKSSILDALCLALYGECPRLTVGGRSDEVPDAGGEAIRARDPRAVVRRGAAQAWAQVCFTGIDGETYRAEWSARRARDRVDGRLQAVSRAVTRVRDGQVLENQSSAVNPKVQALTGLSYDEFRRTVLLAQGDFDAFLRADTNDRAALLEKVTGTGLYRDISVRVFDRLDAARGAHMALEFQRAGHRLLSAAKDTASATTATVQARQGQAHLADAAHQAAEAEFKALGPVWTMAATLDTQIASAATELAKARAEATRATTSAVAAQTKVTDLAAREGTTPDQIGPSRGGVPTLPRVRAPPLPHWRRLRRVWPDLALWPPCPTAGPRSPATLPRARNPWSRACRRRITRCSLTQP